EDLKPETAYDFKIRAVNKDGVSDWTNFSAKTSVNPLEFALPEIDLYATVRSQGGQGVNKLVDFDEGNLWHTAYRDSAVPFDLIFDLKTVNQLDKFEYLPRENAGNGTFLQGSVFYSNDRLSWTFVDSFYWERDARTKIFDFIKHPVARYLKIAVTKAVGNFGSGRELYVFKVPETESYLQGDINNDHKIDYNDLTSYMNYTGLRSGDSDFEGYISNGDINGNGLIDAYDISVVATQLDGGATVNRHDKPVSGTLRLSADKSSYNPDEIVELTLHGDSLVSVNALSFALPYNSQDYEFVGLKMLNTKQMENLTYDRLHSSGAKVLYPTFVNIGDKEMLEGNTELFVIQLKAKKKIKLASSDLQIKDVILVDKNLNYKK
ncbi:MAG: discoidin domain-containing protein, partial [Dysgonamonadaceae bacterium]|nr:discoidin domain-containing protein [Dysgonamonadaceae bacterium]